jgi:hypothetical protein
MANRKFEKWKTYRQGGQRVPGMFKRQEGGEGYPNIPGDPVRNRSHNEPIPKINRPSLTPENSSIYNRADGSQDTIRNAMTQRQAQKTNMINQKMTEMVMQMKLQNDSLQQQNDLLKTQIEKSELINSARNTKQKVGSDNSPKRKGGSVRAKKGKEKRIMFAQSSGATMRHGGSCGGPLMSMMKKSKRR